MGGYYTANHKSPTIPAYSLNHTYTDYLSTFRETSNGCLRYDVNWSVNYIGAGYHRPDICDMRHVQGWTWSRWFRYYEPLLVPIVETCFANLHDDPVCWATPQIDAGNIGPECPGANNMISCVMEYLPQQVSLAMAGAQVILGLAPALISSLSPSIGEISMLSTSRPILSVILAMASPALWSARFLEYDNPLSVLKTQTNTPFQQYRRYVCGKREIIISCAEYIAAILAMFATYGISWQVGFYSVSSWKVGFPGLIFLWSFLVIVPHSLASVSWYFSTTLAKERSASRLQRVEENQEHGTLLAMVKRETTICAAKRRRYFLDYAPAKLKGGSKDDRNEHWYVVWANIIAGWMGWILVLYGTCLFSSLLFIPPLNALICILAYVGATLVCRAIMTYELQGMRAVELYGVTTVEDEPGRPPMEHVRTGMFDRDDLMKVISSTTTFLSRADSGLSEVVELRDSSAPR